MNVLPGLLGGTWALATIVAWDDWDGWDGAGDRVGTNSQDIFSGKVGRRLEGMKVSGRYR